MREYQTQVYTEGTAARKLARSEYARPRPQAEPELPEYAKVRRADSKKGLRYAMNPAFAVFLGAAVLVTLAACTLMLSMQAKVTEQSNQITYLQSEIEVLTDENDAYEARINSSVNLNQIRDTAINQLGMVYPTEGQVVYYDLTEADYVRQYHDIP